MSGSFSISRKPTFATARRTPGIPTDFVRESSVTHIGSASTGMKDWARVPDYWFASRRHYFEKTHGRAYARLATLAHVAGGVLHRLRCLLTGAQSPPIRRASCAASFPMNSNRPRGGPIGRVCAPPA